MASLPFNLKIIGAKNIYTKQKGNLFIRCYLSTKSDENNKRIQLNTKEITKSTQKSDENYIFWDESFSLECNGSEDLILDLKQQSVVFELRWRNTKALLGKISGSQLLATAEMPWKNVFEAPNMEIQRWVFMNVDEKSGKKLLNVEEGVKPPAFQMVLKIAVLEKVAVLEEMRKMRRRERLMRLDECGCRVEGGCCSTCVDNELILIGLAFDDF